MNEIVDDMISSDFPRSDSRSTLPRSMCLKGFFEENDSYSNFKELNRKGLEQETLELHVWKMQQYRV